MKTWLVKDSKQNYGKRSGRTLLEAIVHVMLDECICKPSDVVYNNNLDRLYIESCDEYIDRILDEMTAYSEEVLI